MMTSINDPLPVLSPQQAAAIRFIWAFFQTRRHYPTVREIGEAIGLKGLNAHPYTLALEKKGVLRRDFGMGARNIRLTKLGMRWLEHDGATKARPRESSR
jgi:SOS-response transcriptional repressor LexA